MLVCNNHQTESLKIIGVQWHTVNGGTYGGICGGIYGVHWRTVNGGIFGV